MLRVFLALALKHDGGFGSSSPVDPRSPALWNLFRLAKEYDCQKELKPELLLGVNVLLVSQLRSIARRNRDPRVMVAEPSMDPLELASIAFEVSGIKEAEGATSPTPENYKGEIKQALEEYSKLYELRIKLDAIN
jgi:hypothetical protein